MLFAEKFIECMKKHTLVSIQQSKGWCSVPWQDDITC